MEIDIDRCEYKDRQIWKEEDKEREKRKEIVLRVRDNPLGRHVGLSPHPLHPLFLLTWGSSPSQPFFCPLPLPLSPSPLPMPSFAFKEKCFRGNYRRSQVSWNQVNWKYCDVIYSFLIQFIDITDKHMNLLRCEKLSSKSATKLPYTRIFKIFQIETSLVTH